MGHRQGGSILETEVSQDGGSKTKLKTERGGGKTHKQGSLIET